MIVGEFHVIDEIVAHCPACKGIGYLCDVERIGTKLKQVADACGACGGWGVVAVERKGSEVNQ